MSKVTKHICDRCGCELKHARIIPKSFSESFFTVEFSQFSKFKGEHDLVQITTGFKDCELCKDCTKAFRDFMANKEVE